MCAPGPDAEPPTTGRLIDGKAVAKAIRGEIRESTEALVREHGVTPGLAVVLVGNRTDSSTYVRMKKRAAAEVGFYSVDREFPESVSQEELLACVRALNDDPKVHGILVQLPLPRHINEAEVLEEIKVSKDVDGFSATNIGNMCLRGGRPPLAVPCTPAGCIELLQRSDVDVSGKEVVVLGRSNIVGMPVRPRRSPHLPCQAPSAGRSPPASLGRSPASLGRPPAALLTSAAPARRLSRVPGGAPAAVDGRHGDRLPLAHARHPRARAPRRHRHRGGGARRDGQGAPPPTPLPARLRTWHTC